MENISSGLDCTDRQEAAHLEGKDPFPLASSSGLKLAPVRRLLATEQATEQVKSRYLAALCERWEARAG